MRSQIGRWGALGAAALVASCAVGPNYHQPQTPVDPQFVNASEPGLAAGDTVERYWQGFLRPNA